MQIVISSEGPDMDSMLSPTFGRCPYFLYVETDTAAMEAVRNESADVPGGAGVQAAQQVVDHGARAVLTGRVGPKAARVLDAAGIEVYPMEVEPVRSALEHFERGQRPEAPSAEPPPTLADGEAIDPDAAGARQGFGQGGGPGRGRGLGRGQDRGMGRVRMREQRRGQGRGPGRGFGHGHGRGAR